MIKYIADLRINSILHATRLNFLQAVSTIPSLLFQLLATPPINADAYRFDSVAVKEPKFEIDGVFLPPESAIPGVIYFCKVQFQKDKQLYETVLCRIIIVLLSQPYQI